MKVTPQSLGIPEAIDNLGLRSLSWSDFKGQVPPNHKYQAHLFWYVDYECWWDENEIYYVTIDAKIKQNSWKTSKNTSIQLLTHEYGHYLIACLMALTFKRQANLQGSKYKSIEEFRHFCGNLFQKIHNEHLHLEVLYDNDTEHYYNHGKQKQWQQSLKIHLKQFEK